MDYRGHYEIFDRFSVNTYPLEDRPNKVSLKDFIDLDVCTSKSYKAEDSESLEKVASWIASARENGQPVFWMMGAHPVKNGLSPIILDWLKRDIITTLSMNPAATIHDFELALIGETSEDVPNALPEGKFGLAYETGKYLNDAIRWGASQDIGYGESIARLIGGERITHEGLDESYSLNCPHSEKSLLYTAYQQQTPVTVHASIGTDIIDQHPNFSAQAKGKTSGIDFDIFVQQVTKLENGGVFLNIGTAIMGPEVFLKAVSMAASAGYKLNRINTADFDLRSVPDKFPGEEKEGYYFRDFKSVVTRIPNSFNGEGLSIQGNHLDTLPALYKKVEENLNV